MKRIDRRARALAATALLCAGVSDAAMANALLFADTSLSALHGGGFKVDPTPENTLTLEQVSGWSWGDIYWFVDSLHYQRESGAGRHSDWYGEFSPRLSLSKITGHSMQAGPIKDVLIAATYEHGTDRLATEAALLGAGFDLGVPGFSYLQANLYARKDLHHRGWDTWQLTLAGALPFTVGKQRFLVDGFLDYVAPGGPRHENIHFSPQIKWDLGHALGYADSNLWLGAELDFWKNKYGIANSAGFPTDQKAGSLLLRWHFKPLKPL